MPDYGKEWRDEITTKLLAVAEWCNKKIKIVNPTKYFSYEVKNYKTDKQVKEFYLYQILHVDLVIVNLNNTNTSPGTAQELQFAVDHNIPIIGFGNEECYPWLSAVDCQVVFDSIHEVIDYIRDYYMS